jgi:hypothetical protein
MAAGRNPESSLSRVRNCGRGFYGRTDELSLPRHFIKVADLARIYSQRGLADPARTLADPSRSDEHQELHARRRIGDCSTAAIEPIAIAEEIHPRFSRTIMMRNAKSGPRNGSSACSTFNAGPTNLDGHRLQGLNPPERG